MLPKVSVIIPNYNHAPYLKERIESVLNQTYQDFELIILDDKSPDSSRKVIEQYRENPHVSHIVYNEQNTGNTFIQWECGISLSKGKYIWIAESDDVAEPQLLESLVRPLEEYPEACVAFSHSRLIDADGKVLLEQNADNTAKSGQIEIYESTTFLRHLLIFNYIYNASMAVFRRDAYDKVNQDYKKFRYCGDWHFWGSICAAGSVIEVCDMLSRFRQHQHKVSRQARKDRVQGWNDQLQTVNYIKMLSKLNAVESRCLRGRFTKRLSKANIPEESRKQLRAKFPELCDGNKIDVLYYEIGKNVFGFLRRKNDIVLLSEFF